MESLNRHEGLFKCGLLFSCIAVIEFIGEETLTHYSHKAMEHPIGRWVVPAVVGVTAMHLMDKDHDILPEAIDPYHHIARLVDKVNGR